MDQMSTLKDEIFSLVLEAQSLIKQGKYSDASLIVIVEELWTLLPKNTRKPSGESLRSHHKDSKDIFTSTFYISFTEFLIRNVPDEWLQSDSDRSLRKFFSDFFLLGDSEDSLKILTNSIATLKDGLSLYTSISLLESLFKQNCLRTILSDYCLLCSSKVSVDTFEELSEKERNLIEQSNPVISAISSMPDIITPRLKLRCSSDFFFPQNYVQFVSLEVAAVLQIVYESLQKERNCSVSVLSALIAKLAMTGRGRLMWKTVLAELECVVNTDCLWQRILQRIIAKIPDRCIEAVTMQLIFEVSSHNTLKAILGTLPATRERMKFIFTHKLLLVRCTEQTDAVQNVIAYLAGAQCLWPTFAEAFEKLLSAWSDGASLRRRPLEQSTYLSKAVLIFIAHLQQEDSLLTSDVKDTVQKTVLIGMASYLDSSVSEIRKMGMVVGESLSSLIHLNEKALKFDLEPDDFVKSLQLLLRLRTDTVSKSVDEDTKSKTSDHKSSTLLEIVKPQNENTSEFDRGTVDSVSGRVSGDEEVDSDDFDEDDLIPVASDSMSSKPGKRPIYLAECMEGLLSTDDPERYEKCLRHAERLIRKHPEVSEMAVELCKVLLHLDDHFSLPDFTILRLKAMVAVTVSSPETIAGYLTREFYGRNYSVCQRLDMLNVLSSAAKELSELESGDEKRTSDVVNKQSLTNDTDWSRVIETRLESKTRRFAKGRKRQPVAVCNRFAKVAGWFFYPLMSHFDSKELCIDLLVCDHIVLEHLLRTLGVVMYCAFNIPNVSQMARTLLEFTWCFRCHAQSAVRRAVLAADFMAVLSVPPFLLLSDLCAEIMELKEWLHDEVLLRDSDSSCKAFAAQILVALEDRMQKQLKNDD